MKMHKCEACGREFAYAFALHNHVRMKIGHGHGPQGTYPDWYKGQGQHIVAEAEKENDNKDTIKGEKMRDQEVTEIIVKGEDTRKQQQEEWVPLGDASVEELRAHGLTDREIEALAQRADEYLYNPETGKVKRA